MRGPRVQTVVPELRWGRCSDKVLCLVINLRTLSRKRWRFRLGRAGRFGIGPTVLIVGLGSAGSATLINTADEDVAADIEVLAERHGYSASLIQIDSFVAGDDQVRRVETEPAWRALDKALKEGNLAAAQDLAVLLRLSEPQGLLLMTNERLTKLRQVDPKSVLEEHMPDGEFILRVHGPSRDLAPGALEALLK